MHTAWSTSQPTVTPMNRRRSPRADVLTQIRGRHVALDLLVLVRDVSWGGFSLESAMPFPVGGRHTFQFWTNDGRTTMTTAECRHCTAVAPRNGQSLYVAGFSFPVQRHAQLQLILSMFAATPA